MKTDERLLKEILIALEDAIECWENPDSPEAFCYAMKHLMNIRDRIQATLSENRRTTSKNR
jgi:seryl-tRNA(Sec) selenium transferase